MIKQFQLVATEPVKRGSYSKITAETLKVFKGGDLFKGLTKTYVPHKTDGDPLPGDKKEVVTTVSDRLAWTEKTVIDYVDFEASRDKTNMKAQADLEIDGVVLAKALPATTLLSLEKRLGEVRNYYDSIPTLDLSQEWKKGQHKDRYEYGPIETYRYVKQTHGVLLSPATEKHPAQVKEVIDDVLVGVFKTLYQSGEVHPGEKAEYLARIDKLIEAVKKARMKANETEAEDVKVGKALFDYIHKRSGSTK
jgi:hypothetical protein